MEAEKQKMSEVEKILTKLVKRLEKVGRQQEVTVLMMHLMTRQLDGDIEVSKETMRFYLDAVSGAVKKVEAFRKHCVEVYFT